jgi:hypothetical protein
VQLERTKGELQEIGSLRTNHKSTTNRLGSRELADPVVCSLHGSHPDFLVCPGAGSTFLDEAGAVAATGSADLVGAFWLRRGGEDEFLAGWRQQRAGPQRRAALRPSARPRRRRLRSASSFAFLLSTLGETWGDI